MLAIIQARMSSTRLPGKVMKIVNNEPIIIWQLLRILQTKHINNIVVATSTDPSDDELVEVLQDRRIEVIRGDANNVMDRFVEVLNHFPVSHFIRLTADCPLYMPEICDQMIEDFMENPCDYLSNTIIPTFPNGCDVEIVKSQVLFDLQNSKPSPTECEHVTIGIHSRNNFAHCRNFLNSRNESHLRWTLDTEQDLNFIREVYSLFKKHELEFNYSDVMKAIDMKLISTNLDSNLHQPTSE